MPELLKALIAIRDKNPDDPDVESWKWLARWMKDVASDAIDALPEKDAFSKGYKHRHGEPVSDACGDGDHAGCAQDLSKCHCTVRGGHTIAHAYSDPPPRVPGINSVSEPSPEALAFGDFAAANVNSKSRARKDGRAKPPYDITLIYARALAHVVDKQLTELAADPSLEAPVSSSVAPDDPLEPDALRNCAAWWQAQVLPRSN